MAPTLKEVAQDVGLSLQTVSDVLNCGDLRYSAKTRARIQAAAERLGYRPNLMAQSMVTGRTNAIGMLAPDLDTQVTVEKINAIYHQAAAAGYQVYLGLARDGGKCDEILQGFIDRRVDGLICLVPPDFDPAPCRRRFATGTPLVMAGLVGDAAAASGLPVVEVLTAQGVCQATRHLIDLGHRRIAFAVGSVNAAVPGGRLAGYRQALKESRLRFDPGLVMADREVTHEESRVFTQAMLDRPAPPTAILYSNDEMALVGVQTLAELGLRVPQDISVVGYDDLFFSAHMRPALTTSRQPREDLAAAVMALLQDQIAGRDRTARVTALAPTLVVRQSTGPCPQRRNRKGGSALA